MRTAQDELVEFELVPGLVEPELVEELDVPMSGQPPDMDPDPDGAADPDGGVPVPVPDGGVPVPDGAVVPVPGLDGVPDKLALVPELVAVVEVDVDAVVLVLGLVLEAVAPEAPATSMPIPRLRPSEPATTPAATMGRESFMRCSFDAVAARVVRHVHSKGPR